MSGETTTGEVLRDPEHPSDARLDAETRTGPLHAPIRAGGIPWPGIHDLGRARDGVSGPVAEDRP